MKTETNYRMLEPWENVSVGDQVLIDGINWRPSWNTGKRQSPGMRYRRPLPATPAFVPQWRHPDAPSCPVHVLWAESPSTVRTVAQVAADAKPKAVEPGTGYRLLGDDEIVEFGDEWYNPGSSQGDWNKATGSVGNVAGTMTFTYRRKLPAHEPQYRPYANAAEAAAGLQGKLIRRAGRCADWVPVTRVCSSGSVLVGNLNPTYECLLTYEFTDGTPCGVLITNQGTK